MVTRVIEKYDQTYNHFPRVVNSLCPECLKPLKAQISIKGTSVVMEKSCPNHGKFTEILSNDKDFFLRMEKLSFPQYLGVSNPQTTKQNSCPFDCGLCPEHKSPTMLGVIDLTNRCNFKCPVCFATSNASSFLFEPSFEQVKKMMLTLHNLKPVHAPCLQFSGGEPTLHPRFFDILREARKIGFTQIQIGTNGLSFNNEEFAKKASQAGLNVLYLQFDGVTDRVYKKIRGRNALEIKKKAIENAHKYHLRTILVPTIIKGVNDKEIGSIIRFAIAHIDSVLGISFQPVALTGRIPEKEKNKMRFTLTDLAAETSKQFPTLQKKDWFPLSITSPFSRFMEVLTGKPHTQISCHSHCGMGAYLIVDPENQTSVPLSSFLDVVGLMSKLQEIYEEHQKKKYFKRLRAKLNILHYSKQLEEFYNQSKAPDKMPFKEFISYLQRFLKKENFSNNKTKRKNLDNQKWKLLIIVAMHFQDCYNYEAERSQRCVVHHAAPDGKLYPFCAYNCGPYFRSKVEKQFSKPLKK